MFISVSQEKVTYDRSDIFEDVNNILVGTRPILSVTYMYCRINRRKINIRAIK